MSASLPDSIRVKISSEAAGGIAITPVVVQEMRTRELIGLMLGITRKDTGRIAELLTRGSFVSGASRFRWEPLLSGASSVAEILSSFPDDQPERPFQWAGFRSIRFHSFDLTREETLRRRWFQRRSYFEALQATGTEEFRYVEFSYKDSLDVYRRTFNGAEQGRLRDAAALLAFPALRRKAKESDISQATLLVSR